jgi:putative membrane protein
VPRVTSAVTAPYVPPIPGDPAVLVAAHVLIGLVAVLHAWFLVLEMFLWRTPRARAVFGTTEEFARESATLASNQGLYNGFLVAGLVWALWAGPAADGFPPAVFFLCCVLVAGLYGAATVSRRVLYAQALPAALALTVTVLAR